MLKIQTFGGWGGTKGLSIMAGLTNVYNKGRFIVLNIRIYRDAVSAGVHLTRVLKGLNPDSALFFSI